MQWQRDLRVRTTGECYVVVCKKIFQMISMLKGIVCSLIRLITRRIGVFVQDKQYVRRCNAVTVEANEMQCKSKRCWYCKSTSEGHKRTAVVANSGCFIQTLEPKYGV